MVGGCGEGKQIAVHMDRLPVKTGHLLGQSSRNGPTVCLSLTTFSQCLSDPHIVPILSSLSTAFLLKRCGPQQSTGPAALTLQHAADHWVHRWY